VVRTLKANSARLLRHNRLWAVGYLARSAGKVRIRAVSDYLKQQPEHHGYSGRLLPPVFRYTNSEPRILTSGHSAFDLNHHIVFSTRYRVGIFTSVTGEALVSYWMRVAAARSFAIDKVSVVPDHIHVLVRTVPKMSIEECALLLLNNGQHFIGKQFPQLFVQSGLNELWQPSAYAGTCGELSTALVKRWLSVSG
jgi:putative transposase